MWPARFSCRSVHVEAALGGDLHGVHQVRLLGEPPVQHAGQAGVADQVRVVLGQLAQVDQPHAGRVARGDLGGERAELLGQRDVGLDRLVLLRRERRHVDGVDGDAALQVLGQLLGDAHADDLLGLLGGSGDVRRGQHRIQRRTAGSPPRAAPASKTSSAAPATLPDSMASLSAAPSTSSPRAQLTMRTPVFILAKASRESMLRVSGVSAMCSAM